MGHGAAGGSVAAMLLAAGESTRMGQLKALLPWEGTTLLCYGAEALLASGVDRLVVVLGHRSAELQPLLPDDSRIAVVHNRDYASGKVSSILAGLSAVPVGDHLALLGVDQPRPAALICTVIEAHLAHGSAVSVAAFGGRRGHPVVFAPSVRADLERISEETEGLRSVMRAHAGRVLAVETGDPLALVNLNHPEDYAAALRLSSTSSARAGNQPANRFS